MESGTGHSIRLPDWKAKRLEDLRAAHRRWEISVGRVVREVATQTDSDLDIHKGIAEPVHEGLCKTWTGRDAGHEQLSLPLVEEGGEGL